jgi:protein TonB
MSSRHHQSLVSLLRASLFEARVRAGTGVLLSLAVHVGLIWALLANPDSFGLSPRPSEAISENPYETIVLETIREEDERTAPSKSEAVSEPLPEAVARPEPQVEEKAEPQVEEREVREPTEERVPDRTVDLAAPPKDDPEPEVHAPLKKEERPVEVAPRIEPPRKEPTKKAPQKQTKSPPVRSAPSSRSARPGVGQSGATSASTGAILTYAGRVRSKIAANKPSGNGARGRVTVVFSVSTSGGLAHVRVARSSGTGALDQAAMSAVRRAAPFGQPPAGASSRQLTFTIPITFE